jgi:3-oxoacyl-[acyl-carrier protein] reductase
MGEPERTAIVGGGATGIGRAAAECLARDRHRGVVFGRRPAAGADAFVVGDIAEPEAAEHILREATERFGAPDVLVLNAGGPPPGRILDVGDDQWRAAFELLVLGPLRLARLALPGMAERGFGRIIVVTSTAVRQPQPDLAVSVVLRAAMTSAAKLLAREYADRGVTVNCVAPGPTATARRHQILSARADRLGSTVAAEDAADTATVPAGRPGDPAEVGAAIAFLASAAASYVNGTVLTVDGGRTETP